MGFLETNWWHATPSLLNEQLALSAGALAEFRARGDSHADIVREMVSFAFSGRSSELGHTFVDVSTYLTNWERPNVQCEMAYEAASCLYRRALLERTDRERAKHVLLAASFHAHAVTIRTRLKHVADQLKNQNKVDVDTQIGAEDVLEQLADLEIRSDNEVLHHTIVCLCRNAIHTGLVTVRKNQLLSDNTASLSAPNALADTTFDHPSRQRKEEGIQDRLFARYFEAKRQYAAAVVLPKTERPVQLEIAGYNHLCEAVDIDSARRSWSEIEMRASFTHFLKQEIDDVVDALKSVITSTVNHREQDVSIVELRINALSLQSALCDMLDIVFSPITVIDPDDNIVRFNGIDKQHWQLLLMIERESGIQLSSTEIEYLRPRMGELEKALQSPWKAQLVPTILYADGSPFIDRKKRKRDEPIVALTTKERKRRQQKLKQRKKK